MKQGQSGNKGVKPDTPSVPGGADGSRSPRFAPGRHALVAEDHVIGQHALRWQLSLLGVSCQLAADGLEALALLENQHFDVLITDCQMPHVSGYVLGRTLREREAASGAARLPIIALTASADPAEVARCREAGMDHVLAKPAQQNALYEALRHAWGGAACHGMLREGAPGVAPALPLTLGVAPFHLTIQRALAYDLTALDAAIRTGVVDALRAAVHRLGGALGTCGYEALALDARCIMESLDGTSDDLPGVALVSWRHRVGMTLSAISPL